MKTLIAKKNRSGEGMHPTSPFTIFEPQNPWIDEFYLMQERRATYFKALKLWKGSSGNWPWGQTEPKETKFERADF